MDYREEIIEMVCHISHEGVLRLFYSLFYVAISDEEVMKALEEYAEN